MVAILKQTRKQSILAVSLPGIFLVLFAYLLALLGGITADGLWVLPLYVGGLLALFSVWHRFEWPDEWSRYASFGAVALIMGSLNRAMQLADFWLQGSRVGEWPFYSASPEWAMFKGGVITIVGLLLTVLTWLASGGAKYSPGLIFKTPRASLLRLLLSFYALSMASLVVFELFPKTASVIGQLVPTLHGIGIVMAFFIPATLAKSRSQRMIVVAFLSLPLIWFAIGFGMKSSILLALLPIPFTIWILWRSHFIRLMLVICMLMSFGIISSFVHYYRVEMWYGRQDLNRQEAINGYSNSIGNQGLLETTNTGIQDFISRANIATSRGWAISLADEHRFEPAMILGPIVYVFIPRIIWPDKPRIDVGREYTKLVFGYESRSSTATGLYSGLYLGYGWPAVVFGAIGLGLLMTGLLKLAWKIGGVQLGGIFSFSMLPMALRLEEVQPIGAFSGPVVTFIYLTLFFLAVRSLVNYLIWKKHRYLR